MTALQARPAPETPAPKPDRCGLILLPTKAARELVRDHSASDLRAECVKVLAMNEPTTIGRFAVEVERLAAHYPENRLTPEEHKVVKGDWWRLLGHVPLDLMRAGVDRYVLSTARFFPTPGQLLDLIEEDVRYRQLMAKRASEVLARLDQTEG